MKLSLVVCLLAIAGPAHAEQQVTSLCQPQQAVVFSCRLKDGKCVSLCGHPATEPVSLDFRYGVKERIEISYRSEIKNDKRFHANVLPVNPKASVRQVWLDIDDTRYIVTECVGGRCQHSGGLIVYNGERVAISQACRSGGHPWFSNNIIKFGSDISDSISYTPLIILDEASSEVDSLYPYQLTD